MDIGLILAQASSDPTWAQWLLAKFWSVLAVGAGLTFVIFVHELGHFLVAKACGVKCEKFYVGFDFLEFKLGPIKIPRALIKFQWGETEYGVGSLPLGGYVKMLGQDDDPRNAEKEAERTRIIQEGTAAEGLVEGQTSEGQKVMLDPRSYPAKPVPARMAIISAGVIMNIIFAVIMAAVAYRMGVPEVPAVVGYTAPGTPAWTAGIEPGSKIIQLGNNRPYEHLRYLDLVTAVILNGSDREMTIVARRANGQEVQHVVRPSDRTQKSEGRPQIGIGIARSREVGRVPPALAYLGPAAAPPLEPGDEIVEAAGQPVATGSELTAILAQNPSGPLPIVVERAAKSATGSAASDSQPQRLDVVLQARPIRELGLEMQIGPIVAVRKNSPASDAGFRVGDVIVEINGQPVGDPLSLSQRLAPKSVPADPIEFVVLRKDRQGKESRHPISATPDLVRQFNETYLSGGPSSIESIGVAFDVTNEVAAVASDSPAAKAGIEPGDKLVRVEFSGPPAPELKQRLGFDPYEAIELDDDRRTWTFVHSMLQYIPPESKVTLHLLRDGKQVTATIQPQDSDTFFDESRGLTMQGLTVKHQAGTWGEAFQLGFRETSERLKEVVFILSNLVTGRISPTNLSGPPGIIGVALTFAEQGLPMLLLFLTMLSANLAILNFLPIPALDGGHMLFLLAEWIRGKPVDERLQMRLTVAGVICLLSLMVFATAMDLGRFADMLHQWLG